MDPFRARRSVVVAFSAAALVVPLLPGAAAAVEPSQVGAAARPTPGDPGAGDPYFPLYGNGGYNVQRYDIRVRYNPGTDRLRGDTRIHARARKSLTRFNLDLVGLRVRSVRVNGKRARFDQRRGRELVVNPRRNLRQGNRFRVRVRYRGVPDPFVSQLGVSGFLTTPDGALAVGQPEAAAHWFPANDHPKDKARYRIRLTAPRRLDAVANGLPVGHRQRRDWATTTWRLRDPMASYLSFMAIGRFDVRRYRGAGLPIIDAIDSGIGGPLRRRIESSLGRQGEIIRHQRKWFGPYPFEAAGALVDDIPIGFALENQTRPVYSPLFWSLPFFPTLGDDVVVHELAHMWYGDSVAVRRWRDIWLNEGFATYAEWLWQQREHHFTPAGLATAWYNSTPRNDPFWQLRIGNPGPDNMFAFPVYIRGAMTLQALRARVGHDDFRRIVRAWARINENGHGTTRHFIRLSERVSDRSLDRLFRRWLFTAGKPPRPRPFGAGSPDALAGATELTPAMQRWVDGMRSRLRRGAH